SRRQTTTACLTALVLAGACRTPGVGSPIVAFAPPASNTEVETDTVKAMAAKQSRMGHLCAWPAALHIRLSGLVQRIHQINPNNGVRYLALSGRVAMSAVSALAGSACWATGYATRTFCARLDPSATLVTARAMDTIWRLASGAICGD